MWVLNDWSLFLCTEPSQPRENQVSFFPSGSLEINSHISFRQWTVEGRLWWGWGMWRELKPQAGQGPVQVREWLFLGPSGASGGEGCCRQSRLCPVPPSLYRLQIMNAQEIFQKRGSKIPWGLLTQHTHVWAPNMIKLLASLPNFLPVLSEFVQIYLKIDCLGTSSAVQWLKESTLPLQWGVFDPRSGN